MSNIEGGGFRWDLIRPCKHCPFSSAETRITFQCRERAEEIEESAYRNGFPCHKHAEYHEGDEATGEEAGFVAGDDGLSQHCAGALLMYLQGGGGNVPFEWLDEDVQEQIRARVDELAPVFNDPDEFLDANTGDEVTGCG